MEGDDKGPPAGRVPVSAEALSRKGEHVPTHWLTAMWPWGRERVAVLPTSIRPTGGDPQSKRAQQIVECEHKRPFGALVHVRLDEKRLNAPSRALALRGREKEGEEEDG
jgi:hypothetical protein